MCNLWKWKRTSHFIIYSGKMSSGIPRILCLAAQMWLFFIEIIVFLLSFFLISYVHLGFFILTFYYFVIYLHYFHCLYFVHFWFMLVKHFEWLINILHPCSLLIHMLLGPSSILWPVWVEKLWNQMNNHNKMAAAVV